MLEFRGSQLHGQLHFLEMKKKFPDGGKSNKLKTVDGKAENLRNQVHLLQEVKIEDDLYSSIKGSVFSTHPYLKSYSS
jgi:hypothetical protein